MSEPTAVEKWAPRSVDQLLEEFAELARRIAKGEQVRRPVLTVSLRSGREFEGLLLSVHEARNGGRTLLLHLPGHDRFAAQDVAHIPVASIEALTVRDVGQLDAPPPGAPPPPTRLELRRRVAATEKALQEKLGHPLPVKMDPPEESQALIALAHTDSLLEGVFGAIAASELGREALKKLKAVTLLTSTHAEVTLADGVLTITSGLSHAGRFTAASLQEAVEKVL